MTPLPDSMARCAGRFGLGPDDPICHLRDSCMRHVAMQADRERWPDGYPERVRVDTGLCNGDPAMGAYVAAQSGHLEDAI